MLGNTWKTPGGSWNEEKELTKTSIVIFLKKEADSYHVTPCRENESTHVRTQRSGGKVNITSE